MGLLVYGDIQNGISGVIIRINQFQTAKNVLIETKVSVCSVLVLFVCFVVALRPKSSAMVMARRSVHLTTLFS